MRPVPLLPQPDLRPVPPASEDRWPRRVLIGTALLTAVRLVYASRVELAPQEAYYWQYARHLDLSYFDHPPLLSWLIALSTRLLGSTELGVRLPVVLGGAALTWVVASLTRRLYSPQAGALAALLANCTILFGLGAVVATPDAPLALFWAAALRVLCELVLPDGKGAGRWGMRWLLLGLLCGLALLSKYTAALLLPQVLLTSLLLPRGRQALRGASPYVGLGVAALVFSPVILWNARHGWASFAFQTADRLAGVQGAHLVLVGRYLALQALAVGPLLYLALGAVAVSLLVRACRGDPRALLLAVASLPGLALFTAVSPWVWVKLNWVAPAYLGLVVAAAGLSAEGWARARVRTGALLVLGSGAALVVGMDLMPLVPLIPFHERDNLVSGWRQLAAAVATQGAGGRGTGEPPLVLGWGYKTASELAFYLPGQPFTLSNEALGGAGLAYDFWQSEAVAGRDAIVVADERQPLAGGTEALRSHCAEVEELPTVPVFRGWRLVTRFRIWHCRSLRPPLPSPGHADLGDAGRILRATRSAGPSDRRTPSTRRAPRSARPRRSCSQGTRPRSCAIGECLPCRQNLRVGSSCPDGWGPTPREGQGRGRGLAPLRSVPTRRPCLLGM